MKNKGAKPKSKKNGAFGCDLTEYLESSGQDGMSAFLLFFFVSCLSIMLELQGMPIGL